MSFANIGRRGGGGGHGGGRGGGGHGGGRGGRGGFITFSNFGFPYGYGYGYPGYGYPGYGYGVPDTQALLRAYYILYTDALQRGNVAAAANYQAKLEELLGVRAGGLPALPQFYGQPQLMISGMKG